MNSERVGGNNRRGAEKPDWLKERERDLARKKKIGEFAVGLAAMAIVGMVLSHSARTSEIMENEERAKNVKKIEAEIEHRKLVVRKEAIEAVKEARAHGDLSENFEYYAAKKDKNKNESRIRYLERMLKTAEVISDESDAGEVGLNKKVVIRFEDNKKEEAFKIVTSIRGNSLKGNISIESPIGKALLGRKPGDVVTVVVSDKIKYDVKIMSVEEADDDDEIRSY